MPRSIDRDEVARLMAEPRAIPPLGPRGARNSPGNPPGEGGLEGTDLTVDGRRRHPHPETSTPSTKPATESG
jgi:hypothetical protein